MSTRPVRLTVCKFAPTTDAGSRTVTGWASRAEIDRMGDIVEPRSGRWKLPLPLLLGHDHRSIVGSVTQVHASNDGLRIEAHIVSGTKLADEAWQLVRQGALDSFSIGFRGIEREPIASGWRYTAWELLEVSLVAVPAVPSAKVTGHGNAKTGASIVNHPGAVRLHAATRGAVQLIERTKP